MSAAAFAVRRAQLVGTRTCRRTARTAASPPQSVAKSISPDGLPANPSTTPGGHLDLIVDALDASRGEPELISLRRWSCFGPSMARKDWDISRNIGQQVEHHALAEMNVLASRLTLAMSACLTSAQ